MEPLYFGDPGRRLFGIYHAPRGAASQERGVVLASPLGQEALRAHRAFLELARRLADAGFAVLRFDFFGCGDSEGEAEDGSLEHWQDDVATAVYELRSGGGVSDVSVVGLRLGASLAALAGASRGGIAHMVLWDPVTSGRAYLDELAETQRQWLRGSFARAGPRDPERREVLGFPITRPLEAEIERLDLLALGRSPAASLLIVDTTPQPRGVLGARLGELGVRVEARSLPSPPVWIKLRDGDALGGGQVPSKAIDAVVEWLDGNS